MTFRYNSSQYDTQKELPKATLQHLRSYLAAIGGLDKMNYGELQDHLLAYRDPVGRRLLINQLEPVFVHVGRTGRLWPEEEPMGNCIASAPAQQAAQEQVIRDLDNGSAECPTCSTEFRQSEYDGEKCYVGLLDFAEYQAMAMDFARFDRERYAVTYPVIGLAGEVGELANKWKKVLRDDGGTMSEEKLHDLSKELGDCLWYISAIATDLGLSLEHVAQENINKLCSRRDRGTLAGSGDSR